MVAGGGPARDRAREALEPALAARHRGRRSSLCGLAFVVHEQNAWLYSRSAFLHHALGWTCVVAAIFPLRAGAAAAAGGLAGGLRAHVRRRRGAALRRPRRRADLRPPLGRRRRPMRRRDSSSQPPSRRRSPSPATAGRARARWCSDRRPDAVAGLIALPTEVRLSLQPSVTAARNAIQVLAPDGSVLSGAVAQSPTDGRGRRRARLGLARGAAYTVRWRVTGSDGHSPAGVFTFGVGVQGTAADRGRRRGRARRGRTTLARWLLFAALALVIGPLVVRLLVLRGPGAVSRSSGASTSSRRSPRSR